MASKKLTSRQIKEKLKHLKQDWRVIDSKLVLEKQFKDFRQAVLKLLLIAFTAESLNHHPDIKVFNFNKLEIKLQTHKIRGLTIKDFHLAKEIDGLF